jgi:hypothetical protein
VQKEEAGANTQENSNEREREEIKEKKDRVMSELDVSARIPLNHISD